MKKMQQTITLEIGRSPTLSTIIMVEETLKKYRTLPVKISKLKELLPKQMMHQTLKNVLEYLWKSGKIIYGPRGVQWVFSEPEHLKKMITGSLEL